MRNLENEDQNKKAAQWAKLDEKSRHDALRALLGTPGGRAYIYDLLQACSVFRSAFSSDPLQMARNCGQVEIGLWVMADIESVAPQALQRMISERNQRNADRSNVLDTIARNSGSGSGEPGGDGPEQDQWGDPSNRVDYSIDPGPLS